MAIVSIIIGESGTGKTTALRGMKSSDTLLIQAVKKPLPFRADGWQYWNPETSTSGNIMVTDNSETICRIMKKTQRKIIVLDDTQYIMANEFMRRSAERGFDKFTEIAKGIWDIVNVANGLPDDVRVYLLWHNQTDEQGKTKVKTIGKLLDEKITIEGMVTIVLRTMVMDGKYYFATQNNGSDTTKSPMGMFSANAIENDMKLVDDSICQFYSL